MRSCCTLPQIVVELEITGTLLYKSAIIATGHEEGAAVTGLTVASTNTVTISRAPATL